MSEWPKPMYWLDPRAYGECDGAYGPTDCIPADLGRELYEALREAEAMLDPTGGLDPHPSRALARYEREVGS